MVNLRLQRSWGGVFNRWLVEGLKYILNGPYIGDDGVWNIVASMCCFLCLGLENIYVIHFERGVCVCETIYVYITDGEEEKSHFEMKTR
jgi:hypothetical protein